MTQRERQSRLAGAGAVLAALLVGLAAAPAGAASAEAVAKAKAKELYKAGEKYYLLAEYDKAAEMYRAGYEVLPDPVFLFNIAQSYRLGGKADLALRFYKNYLLAAPKAANVAEVQRLIDELEGVVAASSKAVSAPPRATIPSDADKDGGTAAPVPPPSAAAGPAGASGGTATGTDAAKRTTGAEPPRAAGAASKADPGSPPPAAASGASASGAPAAPGPVAGGALGGSPDPAFSPTPPSGRGTTSLGAALGWAAAAVAVVGGGTALAFFLLRE
jgi:tetratricopeptide (TPR) repeat protein